MQITNSLYLHFPFCRHLCNYCDFYKFVLEDKTQIKKFEDKFLKQWEEHKVLLEENDFKLAALESLYIGGGTPSLWGESGVDLLNSLKEKKELILKVDCEFTLEVDPDSWEEESLEKFFNIGVNRVSVGAQSFDDKILKLLDRQHNQEQISKLLTYLKNKKINYSVDLLLGVPSSEKRNIKNEIDELIKFNPNHFSVYILKTRSNYPLKEQLPEDDLIANEYLDVCEYLDQKGFHQYEISNFAKKNFESIHNQKYWDCKSVAAVGASATGLLNKETELLRYKWKSVGDGFQAESVKDSSLIIEKAFLYLRNKKGLRPLELFGEGSLEKFSKLFEMWKTRHYLLDSATVEHIKLNSLGYLMSDSVLDDIFREINF